MVSPHGAFFVSGDIWANFCKILHLSDHNISQTSPFLASIYKIYTHHIGLQEYYFLYSCLVAAKLWVSETRGTGIKTNNFYTADIILKTEICSFVYWNNDKCSKVLGKVIESYCISINMSTMYSIQFVWKFCSVFVDINPGNYWNDIGRSFQAIQILTLDLTFRIFLKCSSQPVKLISCSSTLKSKIHFLAQNS